MQSSSRRSFTQSLALACVTATGLSGQYAPVQSPMSFLAHQYDWYVDQKNGSDSYDGKSPTFVSGTKGPFQTIPKLLTQTITAGQKIGLAAGSYWQASLALSASNLSIYAYGQYATPVAISSGAWSFSGTTNVYQMTLPVACVTWGGTGRYIAVSEDAARGCNHPSGVTLGPLPLVPMVTLALCAAQAGSYYVSGTTLYVNAWDSSNPASNGYKYAWRTPPMLDGAFQLPQTGWTKATGTTNTWYIPVTNIVGDGSARTCNGWENGVRLLYGAYGTLNTTMPANSTQMTISLSTTAYQNSDLLFVGTEQLVVVSGGGTASLVVNRAQNGSTAAAHTSGDFVIDATLTDTKPGCMIMAGDLRVAGSNTILVNATDGTSPNTNGRVYEYTANDAGLNCIGATGTAVYGVNTQKAYTNDGSTRMGRYSFLRDCQYLHGGKHMAYCGSGAHWINCDGLLFYYDTASIGVVFNADYPSYEGVTFDQCHLRSSNANPAPFLDSGFDGHGNNGSPTSTTTNTIPANGSSLSWTLTQSGAGVKYAVGTNIQVTANGCASTSTVTIATGSRTFTVPAGLGFVAGTTRVRAASTRVAAANTVYVEGLVTSYSGTTLVINVDTAIGSGLRNDGTSSKWTINSGYLFGNVTALAGNAITVQVTSSLFPGTSASSWSFGTAFGTVACNFCYAEQIGGVFGTEVNSINYCVTRSCLGDAGGGASITGGIFEGATHYNSIQYTGSGTISISGLKIINNVAGGNISLIQSDNVTGSIVNIDNCDFQVTVVGFQSILGLGTYCMAAITNTRMTTTSGGYYKAATGLDLSSDYNHFLSGNIASGWQWWDGAAVQTYSTLAAYSTASGQDTHSSFV